MARAWRRGLSRVRNSSCRCAHCWSAREKPVMKSIYQALAEVERDKRAGGGVHHRAQQRLDAAPDQQQDAGLRRWQPARYRRRRRDGKPCHRRGPPSHAGWQAAPGGIQHERPRPGRSRRLRGSDGDFCGADYFPNLRWCWSALDMSAKQSCILPAGWGFG